MLAFITQAILELNHFDCIKYWQVENEPMDPVYPDQLYIERDFLQKEVELVRSLSNKKVIINDWGNSLSSRNTLPFSAELADVVGVDLYYKQHVASAFGKSMYVGPEDSDAQLSEMFAELAKPIWIIELQAEPWEKNEEEYRKNETGSMSPEILRTNLERAEKLPVKEIFLWDLSGGYIKQSIVIQDI